MEQKNNDPIHQYFKPAIVGFWRSGATEEEVSEITGISLPRLVTEYNIIRDENEGDELIYITNVEKCVTQPGAEIITLNTGNLVSDFGELVEN